MAVALKFSSSTTKSNRTKSEKTKKKKKTSQIPCLYLSQQRKNCLSMYLAFNTRLLLLALFDVFYVQCLTLKMCLLVYTLAFCIFKTLIFPTDLLEMMKCKHVLEMVGRRRRRRRREMFLVW